MLIPYKSYNSLAAAVPHEYEYSSEDLTLFTEKHKYTCREK